jgi:outer membrane protein OmpA-like peptidoglycan-associated protein
LLAAPSADAQPRRLAEIEFREGSTRLPEASGNQLVQVALWAHDNFDGFVVIDGHADARGPAAGNVRLSLQRARRVRDQLVAMGVDPSQIIVSAFGAEGRRTARVMVWGTSKLEDTPRQARPSRGARR